MDDLTLVVFLIGLASVVALLFSIRNSIRKQLTEIDNEMRVAAAPAQAIGNIVAGVNQTVASLGSEIGKISTQAEKIATLGQRYEEAERLTKDIHSILIGSYSKGKAGEEALRRSMGELMKMGYVKAKQPVGSGVVEYAISFKDGTIVAIDSKVVSTEEITGLFDDTLSADDRGKLADKIRRKVREKIPEVQKYIESSAYATIGNNVCP